jgi:hypothetical protein
VAGLGAGVRAPLVAIEQDGDMGLDHPLAAEVEADIGIEAMAGQTLLDDGHRPRDIHPGAGQGRRAPDQAAVITVRVQVHCLAGKSL